MENNIKDYREKELKYYVLGNVLMIMLLTGFLETLPVSVTGDATGVLSEIGKELLSAGIIYSVFYTYVFIFDSVIPGNWKDNICSLNRMLPGETIFEDIVEGKIRDKRFTGEEAGKKYEAIYDAIKSRSGQDRRDASNSAWYSIYQKHEKETKVYASNRDYLLCRDMCVATLWIAVVYVTLSVLSIAPFSRRVIAILVIEAVMTNVAMRGKQKRFAYNVIAVDLHSKNQDNL